MLEIHDGLIPFGRLWLDDLRKSDPALADSIHVFSSFFYKKLKLSTKKQVIYAVCCSHLMIFSQS